MTLAASARAWERRAIPLNCITGRSPSNCRPEGYDDEVDALGAQYLAVGRYLNPILVGVAPGPLVRFWVHAGGRRHAALQALVKDGRLPADTPIDCEVFTGQEVLAREISLAENIMRRALHPVDECAAFEAMQAAGLATPEIARDFAITERQVRQRLRLTKLSPAVRDAWRAGTLKTEQAQAMTLATTSDAQDALLAQMKVQNFYWHHNSIRDHFSGKAVRADDPRAIYVGLDAYAAAGGQLDENLFEDHPLLRDVELLDRLARQAMMRAGEAALAEEGFSFCMLTQDVDTYLPRVEPEYTKAESARLEQLQNADFDGDTDEPGAYDAWADAIESEQLAIEQRGLERACTDQVKATAGILLSLDHEGRLEVERGILQRPSQREPAAEETSSPRATSTASPAKPEKPADPIEAAGSGRGMIRTILEATIREALPTIVATTPDLALIFLVARYGGTWSPDFLDREFGLLPDDKPPREGLLPLCMGKDFDKAIVSIADGSENELKAALARIVAGSIKLNSFGLLTALAPMMSAFARRGAPLRQAFAAAMDYDKYFEAATKAATLAALDAMGSELVERGAKKPVLAVRAAEDARKVEWLPFPLAAWAAVPADEPMASESPPDTSDLAKAMGAAIDIDEARAYAFKRWFAHDVEKREGVRTKAGDLYDAYCTSILASEKLGLEQFGKAIAAIGIEKKRFSAGVHYLGIALRGAL